MYVFLVPPDKLNSAQLTKRSNMKHRPCFNHHLCFNLKHERVYFATLCSKLKRFRLSLVPIGASSAHKNERLNSVQKKVYEKLSASTATESKSYHLERETRGAAYELLGMGLVYSRHAPPLKHDKTRDLSSGPLATRSACQKAPREH